jgi:intracellular sulfur oxidation DsrE/DsrF family protein
MTKGRLASAAALAAALALTIPAARAESLPSFPGLAPTPIPENYGYGGFFARHQPVRIVFGVSDPDRQLQETLTNAAYVIRDLTARHAGYRIEIVLYGDAVRAADPFSQRYAGKGPLLKALAGHGVQFRVCYNSLVTLRMDPKGVYGYMKVVPAGILQIVKRQMEGYAYVANR